MKSCIIFGNCQCSGIRLFLKLSNFYEKYELIQYANWELINTNNNNLSIPINQIKNADLIIYQPLSDVYNCYSTNKNNPSSFFQFLKKDCITISFPRIHNNALFPIFHKTNSKNIFYGKYTNNIDNLDELNYLYDNDLLDYDFENRLYKNYNISKQKEENCDVKIIDFIYSNLSKKKCFLTQDHPTSFVFNEVTRQIANLLNLEYDYEKGLKMDENITGLIDSVYARNTCQYPISRYALYFFNFEYVEKEDDDADLFYKNITIDYFNLSKKSE